jgi:hypothetical protein
MESHDLYRKLHFHNRASWNAATVAHNSHKGDQARFFREGEALCIPKRLNFSARSEAALWCICCATLDRTRFRIAAHLGAQVHGVDISDVAIAFARQLSRDASIPATFERADVYDWLEQAQEHTCSLTWCLAPMGWCIGSPISPAGHRE